MSKICLNCENEITDNFCSICGQKTSTHRYSLKHFIVHDLIHGVFHLDKGFLFTIKELYTRPGYSIREFIQGKRANYFNYFTLLVIIITLGHFIGKIPKVSLFEILEKYSLMKGQARVVRDYAKLILLAEIPVYALLSYLIFFEGKRNYTEHLVMAVYYTSAILIFYIFPHIAAIFTDDIKIIKFVQGLTLLLELLYYFWFFYQYFSVFHFSKKSLIFKSIFITVAIYLTTAIINYGLNIIGLKYFNS